MNNYEEVLVCPFHEHDNVQQIFMFLKTVIKGSQLQMHISLTSGYL